MTTRKDDGGPAFPSPPTYTGGNVIVRPAQEGMTLRDRFAVQAMLQGAMSFDAESGSAGDMGSYARWCYAMADAMIAERNRREDDDGS